MRRFNIALVAAIATAGATAAQAGEVADAPAPHALAAQGVEHGARQGAKPGRRHFHRAGTPTAGADSFLPVMGNFVGSVIGSTVITASVQTIGASPQ